MKILKDSIKLLKEEFKNLVDEYITPKNISKVIKVLAVLLVGFVGVRMVLIKFPIIFKVFWGLVFLSLAFGIPAYYKDRDSNGVNNSKDLTEEDLENTSDVLSEALIQVLDDNYVKMFGLVKLDYAYELQKDRKYTRQSNVYLYHYEIFLTREVKTKDFHNILQKDINRKIKNGEIYGFENYKFTGKTIKSPIVVHRIKKTEGGYVDIDLAISNDDYDKYRNHLKQVSKPRTMKNISDDDF